MDQQGLRLTSTCQSRQASRQGEESLDCLFHHSGYIGGLRQTAKLGLATLGFPNSRYNGNQRKERRSSASLTTTNNNRFNSSRVCLLWFRQERETAIGNDDDVDNDLVA